MVSTQENGNTFAGETTDAQLPAWALRLWPRATVLWLPMLGEAVPGLIGGRRDAVHLGVALGELVAFITVYLWLVLRCSYRGSILAPRDVAGRAFLLFTLGVLTVSLYRLSIHESMPPWIAVYVAIAAAVALPPRPAAGVILGVTLAATAYGGIESRWGANLAPMVVGIPVVGMSMIAVGKLVVAVNALQAARAEIAWRTVAAERLRFSRDLHDLLGHSLTTISVKTELARRLLPEGTAPVVAQHLEEIEAIARASLREVREVVTDYRQLALGTELGNARAILGAAGVVCQWDNPTAALAPVAEAMFAWTVREGVTNILRHSRARFCAITITETDAEATLGMVNDGVPSPPHDGAHRHTGSAEAGNGLRGLTERASIHGGCLETRWERDGTFHLCVSVPRVTGRRDEVW